jgi:hypothetical protein
LKLFSHLSASAAVCILTILGCASCGGGDSGRAPVIASFTARPSFITSGQSSTLAWAVSGATDLSISGIGTVTGTSTQVSPAADTNYVLTARNAFGTTKAQVGLAVYAPPKTWFAPRPNLNDPSYGSVDFTALFSPTAPWSTAASHIQVLKLYTYVLDTLPDADLIHLFQDLKRRHIAVAIEWGPLEPSGCGIGVEGFDGAPALHYAQRIRDAGGSLQYIAFDEPFFFGSMYSGSSACNWTPDQVAQDAARHVAQVRTVFPDVIVGDIEVLPVTSITPDWLDRYQVWMDAWERATGAPFAFFHCDVDTDSDWRPSIEAMRRILQQRHIAFGMLYTGTFVPNTDAAWVSFVEGYFTGYETHGGAVPDQVIFQSWQPYPKHLLPETDPTTFTYVIDRYFRERTTLASTADASSIQGKVSASDTGTAVADAAIGMTASPRTGTGQPITYSRTGTVPSGTQYITFGVRVNTECAFTAPADFYISGFSIDVGTAQTLSADFSQQFSGWGWWGYASVLEVQNSVLHVRTSLGESLGINHDPLPLSSAGMPFTFTVNATIPPGSLGNACAIAVFLDASQTELSRVSISLRPQDIALGTTKTAADGTFSLAFGQVPSNDFVLWADYPGSDALWPSASSHLLGSAPAFEIATASLPSGSVGVVYAQTMAAAGGLSPYIWVATGLPPGLALSSQGVLTGIPTTAGTYRVAIAAIDDSAPTQTMERAFDLLIK